jgi:hypothetical protein
MEKKNIKNTITKSPPFKKSSDASDEIESNLQKLTISPVGRLRKSTSVKSIDSAFLDVNSNQVSGCDKCEKCLLLQENLSRALDSLRSYVENLNEKLNTSYLKVGSLKKSSDFDSSFGPDYYHTICYSEVDKLKLNTDLMSHFKFLLKSMRLFSDKYEYILKKHESFEKMAQEYKYYKISNKLEETSPLSEAEALEVKSLSEHSIFKNFNIARENFESCLKDLKNTITGGNDRLSNNNMVRRE